MVQWGNPRNERGPKQTGNLPWATAKADSNWSRPQTWTWTWTRVRIGVQFVLRFDLGLFAMHSPRRDAGQSGRGSCRLYKISALDLFVSNSLFMCFCNCWHCHCCCPRLLLPGLLKLLLLQLLLLWLLRIVLVFKFVAQLADLLAFDNV